MYSTDFNKLIEIRDQLKLTGNVFNVSIFIYTAENNIIATQSQLLVEFNPRVTNKPINVCISTHKLCFRKDMIEIKSLKKPIVNTHGIILLTLLTPIIIYHVNLSAICV